MIICTNCNNSNGENATICSTCSFPLFESEFDGQLLNNKDKTFVLTDENQNRYVLKKGKSILGRSKKADITIQDAFMSGFHAELIVDNNKCLIKDLGSKNGTILKNKRVSDVSETLNSGDQINCGSTNFIFSISN